MYFLKVAMRASQSRVRVYFGYWKECLITKKLVQNNDVVAYFNKEIDYLKEGEEELKN